jgi:hypothetical protein
MKKYQRKWLKKLRKAWESPDKNYILWRVTEDIRADDTGQTDPLTQELAKWLQEALS